MADLTKNAIPSTDFVLDDRTLEWYLRHWQAYCNLMPFDNPFDMLPYPDDPNDPADSIFIENSKRSWRKLFMPAASGDDPVTALLARIANPDGTLPPQQAFLIAFLTLFKTPQALFNTLPARHRALYYRGELGLKEAPPRPDHVALAFTPDDDCEELKLPAGLRVDGGQDSAGAALVYQLDRPLLANHGILTDIRWCQPDKAHSGMITRIVQDTLSQPVMSLPDNGLRLFAYDSQQDKPVLTGRVVASSMLTLSGGTRDIVVVLSEKIDGQLDAQVSGKGMWLPLTTVDKSSLPGWISKEIIHPERAICFRLNAGQGPIIASPGLDGFTDTVPLLKLTRTDGRLVPEVSTIFAWVSGSPDVLFATDDGPAALNKRSNPFGAQPKLGSSIFLVAADWCNKPNCQLTLSMTPVWSGLPASTSFPTWYTDKTNNCVSYAEYGGEVPTDNQDFRVQLSIVESDQGTAKSLFENGTGATPPSGIPLQFDPINSFVTPIDRSADPRDWAQYIRIRLAGKQDFLHAVYLSYLTSPHFDDKHNVKQLAHPPYTPEFESVSVNYLLTEEAIDTQYQLTPFGFSKNNELADDDSARQLYLGFTGILPGQDLDLYWRVRAPKWYDALNWSYLTPNGIWQPLDAQVLDGTNRLLNSGIWHATLPDDATNQDSTMPAGRYWIRGRFPDGNSDDTQRASDYPWLIGLQTNCATATLIDVEHVAPDHLQQPLPAGTIKQTVESVDGLQAITQPWPSEGGRSREQTTAFYARVAQRLNHRNRALTWRDIRTLLTAQYPEVHDVRVANTTPLQPGSGWQQNLIVIPAAGQHDNADPLRPVFNDARLTTMMQSITEKATPWLTLKLNNPTYRNVTVSYQLEFLTGTNSGYAYRRIASALQAHYMPWANVDQPGTIELGSMLDYYEMLAFIEQQEGVARVLELCLDGEKGQSVVADNLQVLVLETPR